MKRLENHSEQVTKQLQYIKSNIQTIRVHDGVEDEAVASLLMTLNDTYEIFNTGFASWSESLRKTCQQMHEELDHASLQTLSEAQMAVKSIHTTMEYVLQETAKFFESEQVVLTKASAIFQQSIDGEVERLREQNRTLMALVEKQKADASKAKEDLSESFVSACDLC
ncbi:hypothetical protein F5877DRAFT_77272 [Lentinula edodes]|nr:hypothetical protein F5877DRAFT_77272 [Lentinula edodes]